MPKIKTKMTPEELNKKVVKFHGQLLFMRLVNSGKSYNVAYRINFVKQVFDNAYEILLFLVEHPGKKNIELFHKICSETHELVSGPYVTPEMETLQSEFYAKIDGLIKQTAALMTTKTYCR